MLLRRGIPGLILVALLSVGAGREARARQVGAPGQHEARGAVDDDPWWSADKAGHLGLSAAMGGGWYATLALLGDDPAPVRLAASFSLALLPGLLKEIVDGGQAGRRFSTRDLTWDLLGAATGSLLGLGAELLWRRLRGRRAARIAWTGGGLAVGW